jgi:hypothetical protein
MRTKNIRSIILVGAHILILLGMLVGYETSVAIIKIVTGAISSNASSAGGTLKGIYSKVIQLDPVLLYGAIGVIALLLYDVRLLGGWIFSFRFSTDRQCKHCKIKTIRTERQPMDRVLSLIFPVKRFHCLGCGRQYLMPDDGKGRRHTITEVEAESALSVEAASHAPRKTRNRFR